MATRQTAFVFRRIPHCDRKNLDFLPILNLFDKNMTSNRANRFRVVWTMLTASVLGCGGTKTPEPSVQWIDPNTVQQGPTLHDELPDALLTRIKTVHAIFADVDETPLDKWIDDFKRDLDPEGNVKIWEDMAVAYTSFCGDRTLPIDARKEVFKVVLMRSMMSDADVLSRLDLKHISVDDAKAIIAAYPGEAKPIEVIRQ